MKSVSLAFFRGIIAIVLFGFSNCALGQFSWIKEFKGPTDIATHRMSINSNDELYIVGNYEDKFEIGGVQYNGGGAYLAKFDQFGNHIWHKILTYPTHELGGLDLIKTDGNGNCYVSGQYYNAIEIEGTILSGPGPRSYIAKFNPDGDLIWTKNFPDVQNIFDIAVNKAGDLVIYLRESIILYAPDGTTKWTQAVKTTWPITTTIDDNGSVYFDGRYSGTLSIGTKSITGIGHYNFFIARLDADGNCELLKGFPREIDPFYDNVTIVERGAMTVDENKNFYISSTYWTKITLDQFEFQGNPQFGGTFVAKIDQLGNVVWASGIVNYSWSENILINNEKLYMSGAIGYNLYFSIFDKDLGGPFTPVKFPLEYVDVHSGFAVDSKDSIYMSGRRRPFGTGILEGFLFKYKENVIQSIDVGKAIQSPQVVCSQTNEMTLATSTILGAEFYEWEISYNGNVHTIISTEPTIIISLITLTITSNFTVRVRGKNSNGVVGQYSNYHSIVVEKPISDIQIAANCNSIYQTSGYSNFQWHLGSSALLSDNIETIYPNQIGTYFISSSNSCGTFTSNEISYQPLSLSDITIPNIITPNDDSLNDFLIVDNVLEFPSISIYNRWGKQVYQNSNYDNSWSGEGLADGTYYYTIQSQCITEPIKGWIIVKQ